MKRLGLPGGDAYAWHFTWPGPVYNSYGECIVYSATTAGAVSLFQHEYPFVPRFEIHCMADNE